MLAFGVCGEGRKESVKNGVLSKGIGGIFVDLEDFYSNWYNIGMLR